MAKAACILAHTEAPASAELTPISCEYVGNKIQVCLGTKDGQAVLVTMTATELLNFVSTAVNLVNDHTSRFIAAVV